jgi:hypothetical protein
MRKSRIVVDGYVATDKDETDLREDALSFGFDQRAFGRHRLLVAFADRSGRFRGLAYTRRTNPPEAALPACIEHCGLGSEAAIAFCDETLIEGPPPPDLGTRFALACSATAAYGIYLVDWFACNDQVIRGSRFALYPNSEWWEVP